jgi:hypothetical protein
MTLSREEVLGLVRQLLDEVDMKESIYRLYLLEKLATSEVDTAAGRTLSAEEVRERVRQWQL